METKIKMNQKQLKQAHVLRNYNEGRISREAEANHEANAQKQGRAAVGVFESAYDIPFAQDRGTEGGR
jgi:hypothetical protein